MQAVKLLWAYNTPHRPRSIQWLADSHNVNSQDVSLYASVNPPQCVALVPMWSHSWHFVWSPVYHSRVKVAVLGSRFHRPRSPRPIVIVLLRNALEATACRPILYSVIESMADLLAIYNNWGKLDLYRLIYSQTPGNEVPSRVLVYRLSAILCCLVLIWMPTLSY